MNASEDQLLDQAVAGDADALAQLLEQHGPDLARRLAGSIPPRWQSVLSIDDVVQETYIDAFLDIKHFEPRGAGSFHAWLTTLAQRNLLDALRMLDAEKRGKNRRRVEARPDDESFLVLYERLAGTHSSPSRCAARDEARVQLERAIEQLPEQYRTVIRMIDLQGAHSADVARVLNRSPGAVVMLRSRAHRCLRQTMGTASLYLSGAG
ncbi:MAG: sigma-70 family RNA polymerase sigma factor [Phycisphaerae bacterium]|jgi:RNA polymerase sigma-70 factor (ECF subfamily)